ncbi:Neogenin, partial [Dactylosporangium sp. NPDC049140]
NGQAAFSVFSGFNLTAGQVCATFADNTQVCNTTTITTAGGNAGILFQRLPAVPAVPTGLSAPTPTNRLPVLTWHAVPGAVSYLVYRDGAVAGSTTATTFTDYAPGNDGAFGYAVAAVGGNGAASASSAPITVVYDTAAPFVSGTPDRPANAAGWYSAPVTVAWSSTDPAPSSGTATVPATTTAAADGADQALTSGPSCDPAGNCAAGRYQVSIDTTPPTINYSVTPSPNGGGWNNGTVMVAFTCADGLSGVASCPAPVEVGADGAEQRVAGTAVDNAGNTASVTAVVNLDATAPAITASVSQSPNGEGWNSGAVTVTFSCTDALSGIAGCSPPVVLTDDGPNQTVRGVAVDKAGNTADATVIVSIDKTKPLITAVRTPANEYGWNNGAVTVDFTCGDAVSGISVCPDRATVTTEGAGQSVTGVATSHAGTQATATVTGINIDKTAPTITATVQGTRNAAGWYHTAPTLIYACADALSGVATCPAELQVTHDGAGQSLTGTAADKAGNTADATVSGLNVDLTAPVVTIAGAVNGATYSLDHPPAPMCVTVDATSGVANPASLSVNRTASGAYTATCAGGMDIAGNAAPARTIGYTVAPTNDTLADLTAQYLDAVGAPNANGLTHDLANKLAHGQICQYITTVGNAAGGPHPALTAAQAADLTYWARLLNPMC